MKKSVETLQSNKAAQWSFYFVVTSYLLLIIFIKPVMAQSNLTKEQFAERLEQASENGILEISYFEIADFELPTDTIKNVRFENTEWSKVDASNKKFINVTFEDCVLKNINMRNAFFENVKFKNCELLNVVMNESKILKTPKLLVQIVMYTIVIES